MSVSLYEPTQTTRKWTSQAGPRQTKEADKALGELRRLRNTFKEITDYGTHVLWSMYSAPTFPAAIEAMDAIGEQFNYTLTRENYKQVIACAVTAAQRLAAELPVIDKRTTPEQRAVLEQERIEREAKQAAAASAHKVEFDKHVAELRQQYPWAEPDGKLSDAARAAKNIRMELATAFPGVKFSVRSDNYSMGNSVDIRWTDGPSCKEVEALASKYQGGHFNGMEDIYEYDRSAYGDAVESVLGRAKYVQTHRECSDGVRQKIAEFYCQAMGKEFTGDYDMPVYDNANDRLHDMVYRVWNISSFPPGGVVTGLEECDTHPWYRAVCERPANSPAAVASGDVWYRMEKHHHTKHGFDFHLVVPLGRLGDEEFSAKRASCEAAGGWYSRRWGKCPGGFAFKDEQQALAWANS